MRREGWFVVAGGLAMAGASIVGGAGYGLTPAEGPGRFGAFEDQWMESTLIQAGLYGGFVLLFATLWLAGLIRGGRRRRHAIVLTGLLNAGYAAAAATGLWISFRADPPLPPSWDWLRLPHAVGLAGFALWAAGAWAARHEPPNTERIPGL
jgi:hypothetical protein